MSRPSRGTTWQAGEALVLRDRRGAKARRHAVAQPLAEELLHGQAVRLGDQAGSLEAAELVQLLGGQLLRLGVALADVRRAVRAVAHHQRGHPQAVLALVEAPLTVGALAGAPLRGAVARGLVVRASGAVGHGRPSRGGINWRGGGCRSGPVLPRGAGQCSGRGLGIAAPSAVGSCQRSSRPQTAHAAESPASGRCAGRHAAADESVCDGTRRGRAASGGVRRRCSASAFPPTRGVRAGTVTAGEVDALVPAGASR